MRVNSKPPSKPTMDLTAPRVALTLKISKPDYIRLTKLRVKELEAGRDVSHQDILYEALQKHLLKRGV